MSFSGYPHSPGPSPQPPSPGSQPSWPQRLRPRRTGLQLRERLVTLLILGGLIYVSYGYIVAFIHLWGPSRASDGSRYVIYQVEHEIFTAAWSPDNASVASA